MNWRELPPLSALRAFVALAQTGSFTAAGAALSVSHAAVSQQVRGLEARLGCLLVQRGGRKPRLTAEGERLAAALDAAFRDIAARVAEITGADAARPLQISTTPSFAAGWLMPRISTFRHAHPEIEMMLNPTADVVTLAPGGIDLAIRFGTGGWPGLDADLLVASSLVIVGTPALIGDRRIVEPADILDLPWFQEYGTNEVSAWLAEQNVTTPKHADVVHLPGHLGLEAMRRGEGITATARLYVEREIAEGTVLVLFEKHAAGMGYWRVTRPGPMRPPLKAFAAALRRAAAATPRAGLT